MAEAKRMLALTEEAGLRHGCLDSVDHARRPAEDFAGVTIEYETDNGTALIGEATTSWS